MQFLSRLVACLAVLATPFTAYAGSGESLATKLSSMSRIQANFTQTITDIDGELVQAASGTVSAQRPAKLRWSITSPDEQLVIIDGSKVWRYEADLEQVTVDSYNPAQAAGPALLLNGDVAALEQDFDIVETASGYVLSPYDESALFVEMEVEFNDDLISKLVIKDGFDQITAIQFSNVDLASEHAPELYIFTTPAGVDVLRND